MNAQECRTLTATCVLNYIPYTLHLNRVLVLLTTHPAPKQGSGTRVSDLRVGGTWLCHYINWKPLWHSTELRAMHCLFTLWLYWQLTSKAQNGNQSCSWGRCHVNTVAHYYSTGQDLTWPLFLYATYTRIRTFYDDPYHIIAKVGCDGRTDKNRPTIAITLRLRFAARVNKLKIECCI